MSHLVPRKDLIWPFRVLIVGLLLVLILVRNVLRYWIAGQPPSL